MSEVIFPAHISAALDRLTVPALPTGFGDRLLARIAAGDLPEEARPTGLPLPELRRPVRAAGWRRSGRIVMVTAAFGLATATAAASGVFGDAVYIPVVSQVLAKAKIIEMPAKKPLEVKGLEATKFEIESAPKATPIKTDGKEAILALLKRLGNDPEFRGLPRIEQQTRLKNEITNLIANGTVQKADVKAARKQLVAEREARRKERFRPDLPELEKRFAEMKQRALKPDPDNLTPKQREKLLEAYKQLNAQQQLEIRRLLARRRDATPEERRAIWREIRDIWKRSGIDSGAENPDNSAEINGVRETP